MEYKEIITERSKQLYYPEFKPKKSSRRWYQHDIDTIIYSEMFRKMQRKSQLLSIQDPISRSRLIHTFEVVRIAKEISEKLSLNSELTEAIALAHDFGNVAYGKVADLFLQEKTNELFKHEEISGLMLKICASRLIPDQYRKRAEEAISKNPKVTHVIKIPVFPYEIEVYKYKRGIYYVCMSPEVLDGIIKHGTNNVCYTLEGQVVNYADNIAYLIQDISDFEETGIFDKDAKSRYMRCLIDLEEMDKDTFYPLSGIVGATTSLRTATLIERFVSYNADKILNNQLKTHYSELLGTDIPILEIESIVKKAIDRCWEFKKDFYEDDLIRISNITSKSKMEQVWDIIQQGTDFCENNKAYMEFDKMLNSPIFMSYKSDKMISDEKEWENWKKAFFISNLTCDEIDLVIKSFLERDYLFDLSLLQIK